ncbi:MAG: DoxX family protein [Anaerolineae bacterium]|nr:DoxX family protein [Anaerolineae bacterium]
MKSITFRWEPGVPVPTLPDKCVKCGAETYKRVDCTYATQNGNLPLSLPYCRSHFHNAERVRDITHTGLGQGMITLEYIIALAGAALIMIPIVGSEITGTAAIIYLIVAAILKGAVHNLAFIPMHNSKIKKKVAEQGYVVPEGVEGIALCLDVSINRQMQEGKQQITITFDNDEYGEQFQELLPGTD